jgi:hypothetical protein
MRACAQPWSPLGEGGGYQLRWLLSFQSPHVLILPGLSPPSVLGSGSYHGEPQEMESTF